MRLDKFLKTSRILKRRSVAKEVCDADRVLVNGKEAKPSKTLAVGDEITVFFGDKKFSVRVTSLEMPKGKDGAKEMFEVIAE